jgi:hypothetical protein
MLVALGILAALLGAVRLAAASVLRDVALQRRAWLWIAAGLAAAVAQA